MKYFSQSLLAVAIIVPAFVMPVHAQPVLEEIVVSARKRTESPEDSPISATAFTEDAIRQAGIQSPQDFVNLTPNVTLVQTQNAGNSFLNIRGVSQARNSEMSAAVLIDGVLMSNPAQLNQQLFEIEQVEVLRGPQGALSVAMLSVARSLSPLRRPLMKLKGSWRWGRDPAVLPNCAVPSPGRWGRVTMSTTACLDLILTLTVI